MVCILKFQWKLNISKTIISSRLRHIVTQWTKKFLRHHASENNVWPLVGAFDKEGVFKTNKKAEEIELFDLLAISSEHKANKRAENFCHNGNGLAQV